MRVEAGVTFTPLRSLTQAKMSGDVGPSRVGWCEKGGRPGAGDHRTEGTVKEWVSTIG